MEKKYSVLIVDDHPLISNAYKSAFEHISSINDDLQFNITIVNNIDSAYQKINDASKENGIDIVFLDIKLPPSKDGKILSGEDLGCKVNQLLPKTKTIISTTLNDNYRVHSIFKSVNPDGFLIKNDITPSELVTAILTVIKDPPYYSKTVLKLLRKQISNEFILDKIDRQILYELSIGTKMKELPNILPMSIGGIEKRKRQLKEIFDVQQYDDKELIESAREKGFI
jgi:DNA-binding NarL/FixJ family response regulator